MKNAVMAALILAAIAGGAYFALTNTRTEKVLGTPPAADALPVPVNEAVKQVADGADVTVKGEITEKCPTSGCWFYMKDATGRLRVDTQFSGFNVLDVRPGSTVTVHGRMAQPEGGEPEMTAAGIRIEG